MPVSRQLPISLGAAVLSALLLVPTLPAKAPDAPMDVPAVIAKVLPAVVTITTWVSVPNETQPNRWKRFYGSGFIIDPSRLVVTNKHVIDGESLNHISTGLAAGRAP